MPDNLLDQSRRHRQRFIEAHRPLLDTLVRDGQHPQVLFITCADSRITPESLFDLDPGDFFVVRNVANTVPPVHQSDSGVSAALEYAVQVLDVPHIVVCGHTQCGGVQATDTDIDMAAFPALTRWVEQIHPAKRDVDLGQTPADPDARHRAMVEQHVRNQLANLLTYGFVRDRVTAGTLELHGWVYYLEEPAVGYLNPDTNEFEQS